MALALSSVAATALGNLQNELVSLSEQKLMGSLTDEQHSAKVDLLLPSPDGDEAAWAVPTPAAPAHLEVIKILNGWRDIGLLSNEKCADIAGYVIRRARQHASSMPGASGSPSPVPLSRLTVWPLPQDKLEKTGTTRR